MSCYRYTKDAYLINRPGGSRTHKIISLKDACIPVPSPAELIMQTLSSFVLPPWFKIYIIRRQGGTRTRTGLLPGDFKSPMSTIPSPTEFNAVGQTRTVTLSKGFLRASCLPIPPPRRDIGAPGLEPRLADSESAVLPLHHTPLCCS